MADDKDDSWNVYRPGRAVACVFSAIAVVVVVVLGGEASALLSYRPALDASDWWSRGQDWTALGHLTECECAVQPSR